MIRNKIYSRARKVQKKYENGSCYKIKPIDLFKRVNVATAFMDNLVALTGLGRLALFAIKMVGFNNIGPR